MPPRERLLPLLLLALVPFIWGVDGSPLADRPAPIAGYFMEGSDYETPYHVIEGSAPGPTLLVLGGVHGDEPGGFRAAEELITRLRPERGTLIVVPRANIEAVKLGVRSTPDLGDLNRVYGAATWELPMAEMAYEIVMLVEDRQVDAVIDLHESWAPYVPSEDEVEVDTAQIGQTVSSDLGEYATYLGETLVQRTNALLAVDDPFTYFEFPDGYEEKVIVPVPSHVSDDSVSNLSSSYTAELVPGTATLLVEISQQQPVERRVGQAYLLVRELLALMAEEPPSEFTAVR